MAMFIVTLFCLAGIVIVGSLIIMFQGQFDLAHALGLIILALTAMVLILVYVVFYTPCGCP